jgi:putative nucleotidyltransferase with HDIG domain
MIATEILNSRMGDAACQHGPGTAAHCKRVAAWCEELVRSLELPPGDGAALMEAARIHHQPNLIHGECFDRLVADIGIALSPDGVSNSGETSRLSDGILAAFSAPEGTHDDHCTALARILESANCLDEQLEFAPFEEDDIHEILNRPGSEEDRSAHSIAFAIRQLTKARRADLAGVLPKLPVYPAAAMRLYALLSQDDVSMFTLQQVANSDQVLAGKLVRAANSLHYSPVHPIRTVAQALSYVGLNDARRILVASSVQPLYTAPRTRKLWMHALEAAQVAERLASLAGRIDPGEAFLLGLLHDVGKLAISLLSTELNDALTRLSAGGCQISAAELVLCGFDHAEAGAEVLRHWNFAAELVSAVRHHHQPERSDSRLAAILYLTEFWIDSEEDLPSNSRLSRALSIANLTPEAFETARIEINSAFRSL